MHRSGTSAVTRVISLLGMPLCRRDDLYMAPDNPTGHWESTSLVGFNDRLLDAFGGRFTAPPIMPDGWESRPEVTALRDEARDAFRLAHPTPTWVWKDPRTCLTLPFWRSVWPDAPVAVFVHREPLGVALSLQHRDGLGKAHCIALWERYARSGLSAVAGLPTVTVCYDELLADPVAAVQALRADLARLGVSAPGDAAEAAGFVAASQPSSHSLADDPDATCAQRSLLAAINALPRVTARFAAPDLGAESASTTELLAAIRERLNYHPTLRMAARAVWPAFRRTADGRLRHRASNSGRPAGLSK